MRWVLCYDVTDDKRRARLFKKLKGFLRPVQKSVFEGLLPVPRRRELERSVLKAIDPEVDSVRLYPMCAHCAERMILLGSSAPVPDPGDPVFF